MGAPRGCGRLSWGIGGVRGALAGNVGAQGLASIGIGGMKGHWGLLGVWGTVRGIGGVRGALGAGRECRYSGPAWV